VAAAARALGLWLALAAAGPVAAAVDVPVDTLALEMDPRDAEVVFRKDKNDTSTFPVTVRMADGRRLAGRIGTKGGFTQGFAKKPLLIKLDKGNRWFGQSRISLNAMSVDRSLMREWLAWDLIHALGMAAPVTRYTFVTINGRDTGLYFRIEWIGPDLFERHGFGREADMYDPVDKISCADLTPQSVEKPAACWVSILPGGDNFDSLKALVAAIDREPVETFPQFLDREFDAESVINWIVVTIVTANTTTYNDEYFLIRSHARRKWFVIPWAYDRSFGWAYEPSLPEPAASDNENFQYYYPLELGAANPLRDKVFMNPQLQQRLTRRIGELVGSAGPAAWHGWLNPARLQERITRVRAAIEPYLARDRFVDRAQFDEKLEALRHYAELRGRFLERIAVSPGDWVQDRAVGSLPDPGQATHLLDGWGYLMAAVKVQSRERPGGLEAAVQRGRPELVPPGAARGACVQRSWFLTAGSAAQAEVTVEYLQESRAHSELGAGVGDERQLQLYARDARGWWQLPTERNTLANTLRTPRLALPEGQTVRLVACEAPAAQALAAP